jgi:hypothetical protein
MRLSRPQECASDLVLDQWASDELEASAREHVERHVATCAHCRARHEVLERERVQFYASAPSFDSHARQFVKKPERQPRPRDVRMRALIGAAAIAAVASLVVLPETLGTRLKGGPSIGYFVKRGGQVRPGDAASVLHAGDLLRFTYSSEQDRYLALFNRDSRSVTVYYPTGPHSSRVHAGSRVALDFSVELDDAPGSEHVYALFCAQAFETSPLRAALASTGNLPVPDGCELDTLTLRKEPVR